MTKLEFLTAFKQVCEGLPTELVESAVADFERQFTDQFLKGAPESTIVERWGSPQHAALKLKVGTLNGSLKQTVSVEKVARVGMSGVGLLLMDLVLFVPGMIYLGLLSMFYVASLLVYLIGIFVTASSIAGVNYIDVPTDSFLQKMAMKGSTHLDIGNIDIYPSEITIDSHSKRAIDTPAVAQEISADRKIDGLHIGTHLNKNTIWKGMTTTLSGMVSLVLCFLATRYTYHTLRQFVSWHFTVLKNA